MLSQTADKHWNYNFLIVKNTKRLLLLRLLAKRRNAHYGNTARKGHLPIFCCITFFKVFFLVFVVVWVRKQITANNLKNVCKQTGTEKGATQREMTEMLSRQQDNGHKSGSTVQIYFLRAMAKRNYTPTDFTPYQKWMAKCKNWANVAREHCTGGKGLTKQQSAKIKSFIVRRTFAPEFLALLLTFSFHLVKQKWNFY